MAAMQTGARRATSATGAKTGKGKNGEVIVEKVMTSDSFLSREIKKAPLIEHDGSLVADISHIPNDLKITIQGAREHNLKNVDLAIPRNRMVVFTGLSGSGKSSLAFDTLFAEGQRRYVESLSAYARQFLGQMDKPDVDFIEGLSPAVSIDQKTTNRNPRSTVGTITEIYDYLRLLFARTGIPHCPECGEPVASQTPQQIVDTLLGYPERTRFQILAPVVKGRKPDKEKFAGAEATYTIEAMMKDGKALQSGTSHYFGDKFSKAYDVTFTGRDNQLHHPFQTSWGVSTRLVGAIIMTHGDDDGLILPPAVAPIQVVVVPIAAHKPGVSEKAAELAEKISKYARVKLDDSDNAPGWKFSQWEMKGVPLRLEIGPKDLEKNQCVLVRRDTREKVFVSLDELETAIPAQLEALRKDLYERALANREKRTWAATTMDQVKELAKANTGYIKTMWCGDLACEMKMKEEVGLSSRCMPFEQEHLSDVCPCCGKPAKTMVYWGVAY